MPSGRNYRTVKNRRFGPTIRFFVLLAVLALFLPIYAASAANANDRAGKNIRLLVLGDSLVAGYGLPKVENFTVRLAQALTDRNITATVINAGVSGDTTTGGKSRLGWALADKPDAVILELGANDGLRGIEPMVSLANLDAIITRLKNNKIKVLLAGMKAPPNLGKEYSAEFNRIFPALADKHNLIFYPFFLEGVAAKPNLNQEDKIHPNADGVDEIVKRILPRVLELIGSFGE
jgi:acyl-CoA thioesterase-1